MENVFNADENYLKRYMCVKDFCPCSNDLESILFGDRQAEFEKLENTGEVLTFYKDCYQDILLKKGLVPELPKILLVLMERFEVEKKCGGICGTNLFHFFHSNMKGSPPNSCREHYIEYFQVQAGSVGKFGLIHGSLLLAYFLVVMTFLTKFGENE